MTPAEDAQRAYAISGLFLTRPVTGMERYAIEITRCLDQIMDSKSESIFLVVPRGFKDHVSYDNIRVVETGRIIGGNFGGYLWEQISFARFLRLNGAQGYLPMNFVPAVQPDVVVTIHDGNALTHREFYPSLRKQAYRQLAAALLRVARRRTDRILTVSEVSRDDLVGNCGFSPERIKIAPPGLEHVHVGVAATSLDIAGPFYFALSSATYNKNFEWVLRTAERNTDTQFVIAGAGDFEQICSAHGFLAPPDNVRHLGYVTDDQRNWLYAHCEAFLFPSRYEGFGLPPLEAACLGAPIVVSDIPAMREIFGGHFRYVDPDVPATDLRAVTNNADAASLRRRYTWSGSASAVLTELRKPYADRGWVDGSGDRRPT